MSAIETVEAVNENVRREKCPRCRGETNRHVHGTPAAYCHRCDVSFPVEANESKAQPPRAPRRIVQIVSSSNGSADNFRERLYAVAEDGSAWRMDDPDLASLRGIKTQSPKRSTFWYRLPPLPGIERPEIAEGAP